MKNILVIHHSADFDGLFCREIAKHFLGDTAEYVGWDYGESDAIVPPGINTIYMLDISIESWMNDPRLIWIDHHKSAIEKYGNKIYGYRIDGVAACRLAWQWFTGNHNDPQAHPSEWRLPVKEDFTERRVGEPLAVRLAGEYDIWDKRDPRAELFQHGLRSQVLSDNLWELLLTPTYVSPGDGKRGIGEITVDALLDRGEAVQFAKTAENADIITSYGFTIEFEGLKMLACNHARYNSHLFTAGLTPEHEACFGFKWTGTDWSVSLYHAPGKEHHDLSLIAAKYGGGGHRGACGFRSKTLPFLA
jgi:hypothetical protein